MKVRCVEKLSMDIHSSCRVSCVWRHPVFLTAHVQQGIVILITNIYLEPKCHCSNNVSTLLINKITEKVD